MVLWQLEQWMESLKKHIFAQRIKTGTLQDLLRINQHWWAVLYSRLEVTTVVNKIQYEVGFFIDIFSFQLAQSQRKFPSPQEMFFQGGWRQSENMVPHSCWRHWRESSERDSLFVFMNNASYHTWGHEGQFVMFIHFYWCYPMLTSHDFRLNHLEASSNGCGLRFFINYCPRKDQDGLTRIDQIHLPGCEFLDGQLCTWVGALWVAAAR